MALSANALVTLAALKDFLGNHGAGDDPQLEPIINRVSDLIERWCQRPFKEVTYSNVRIRGPHSRALFVAHAPINVSVAVTVTISGVVQTVWRTEADGDPDAFDVVVARSVEVGDFMPDHLFRSDGWAHDSGAAPNVLLGYTGGLATIPDDVQQACLGVCDKLWREQQRHLADVGSVALAAGTNVTWTPRDYALPSTAYSILQRYRLPVVA
jgi:hypothetical protein